MSDQVMSLCALELHYFAQNTANVDPIFKEFVTEYLHPFLFFLGDPLEVDALRVFDNTPVTAAGDTATPAVGLPQRDGILYNLLRHLVSEMKAHVVSGRPFSLVKMRKTLFQCVQRVGEIRTTHYKAQFTALESSLRSRSIDDCTAERYYYSASVDDNLFSLYFCPTLYPTLTPDLPAVFKMEALEVRSWIQLDPNGSFVMRVTLDCVSPAQELRRVVVHAIPVMEGTVVTSLMSSISGAAEFDTTQGQWRVSFSSVQRNEQRSFLVSGCITSTAPVRVVVQTPRSTWAATKINKNRRVAAFVAHVVGISPNMVRVALQEDEDDRSPVTSLQVTFDPLVAATGGSTPTMLRQKLMQAYLSNSNGIRLSKLCGYIFDIDTDCDEGTEPTLRLAVSCTFLTRSLDADEDDEEEVGGPRQSRRKIQFSTDPVCSATYTVPCFIATVEPMACKGSVREEVFRQHLGAMVADLLMHESVTEATVVQSIQQILEDPQYGPPRSSITVSPEMLELRFAVYQGAGCLTDLTAAASLIESLNGQQFVPSAHRLEHSHWVSIRALLSAHELQLYRSVMALAYINREASNFIMQHHVEACPGPIHDYSTTVDLSDLSSVLPSAHPAKDSGRDRSPTRRTPHSQSTSLRSDSRSTLQFLKATRIRTKSPLGPAASSSIRTRSPMGGSLTAAATETKTTKLVRSGHPLLYRGVLTRADPTVGVQTNSRHRAAATTGA